jgi:hypothetical protein
MHERFDEVMSGLDIIAKRQFDYFCSLSSKIGDVETEISIMRQSHDCLHQRELQYLQTLSTSLDHKEGKEERQFKIDKIKELIDQVAKERALLDLDRSRHNELRSSLTTKLCGVGTGVRDPYFTGAACPELKNPGDLVTHIDGLPTDYHLGTIFKIYQEFGIQSQNYTPVIIEFYLNKILQNRPNLKHVSCLTIADLNSGVRGKRRELFGLEKVINSFLIAEDTADTLIIPICLQAKWQMVVINKLLKSVNIFAGPTQQLLLHELTDIIQQNIPKDFTYECKLFNLQVSPVYYGALIVEIVRCLSANMLYDAVLREITTENLALLCQTHTQLFQPSQQLLSTRQTILADVINPMLNELLSLHLLERCYLIYPEILPQKASDLAIDYHEIEDIKNTLQTSENVYHLYQACCDKNLFKELFHIYQQAGKTL